LRALCLRPRRHAGAAGRPPLAVRPQPRSGRNSCSTHGHKIIWQLRRSDIVSWTKGIGRSHGLACGKQSQQWKAGCLLARYVRPRRTRAGFSRVPQTSQSAVSRVSQPAERSFTARARFLNGLPIGKSAVQQVGKPAVRFRHLRSGPPARVGRSSAAAAPERRLVVGFGQTATREERAGT